MEVRPALPVDLRQCAALDHQYTTTRVWQIDRRDENGAVTIAFHPVRLPRPMRVRYPRDANRLWEDWRQWDAFFVAEEDGYIRGYAGLLMHAAEGRAWIRDLVVGRRFRRKRTGSRLLQEAMKWAAEQNLNRITVEMQSKNYPMISFSKKHGFVFCGFNEFHYPSQDIALFFTLRL
ncbi:MAG: GNAT family N-acetyltransferase [Ardenticatenales bacterium]|nr:GNAT family N-acetyltransferase [Ardenticatenales bacterium]